MSAALDDLRAAAAAVHVHVAPTPQHPWPLLRERCGMQLWVKHENHTPAGAFKVRGGIVYFDRLLASGARLGGVVSATRGNHGQSIALAARQHNLPVTIVVPHGNSREKNAAMRALGATLIEHGDDFQSAREHAQALAAQHWLAHGAVFPSRSAAGVASYALELFDAVPKLDAVVVPIGMGSGACGVIAARDALGLDTEVIGGRQRWRAGVCAVARGRPCGRPRGHHRAGRRHGVSRAGRDRARHLETRPVVSGERQRRRHRGRDAHVVRVHAPGRRRRRCRGVGGSDHAARGCAGAASL